MYYIEDYIDGILCAKHSPDGPWICLTVKQLSERLMKAEARLREIDDPFKDISDDEDLYTKEDVK